MGSVSVAISPPTPIPYLCGTFSYHEKGSFSDARPAIQFRPPLFQKTFPDCRHVNQSAGLPSGGAMGVDMVRDDPEGLWHFGAPPFDKLQPNQKLALLAQVGVALLCKDQPRS
jgi:hypothetical protein